MEFRPGHRIQASTTVILASAHFTTGGGLAGGGCSSISHEPMAEWIQNISAPSINMIVDRLHPSEVLERNGMRITQKLASFRMN